MKIVRKIVSGVFIGFGAVVIAVPAFIFYSLIIIGNLIHPNGFEDEV